MTADGRVLVCTSCGVSVRVYEAMYAAALDADHEWIDPATYVCGTCLEA